MNKTNQVFPVVQPSEFQINIGMACCHCNQEDRFCRTRKNGTCCKVPKDENEPCPCQQLNSAFTLYQSKDDVNKYQVEFGDAKPAGATRIELVLSKVSSPSGSEESNSDDPPKYLACVSIYFEDEDSPSVSWIRTGFEDYRLIGTMRSRVNSSKCCFPKTITCNAPPEPDYCAPHRDWQGEHDDDLNGSALFPQVDVERPEDSPEVPLRYMNGELNLRHKDLSSNGFGIPWGQTRIYSNRLTNNYDYGFGTNWLIHEQPMLVIRESRKVENRRSLKEEKRYRTRGIAVVRGTRNALWFDEQDWQLDEQVNPNWSNEQRTNWKKLEPRFGQDHQLLHFPDEGLFRLVMSNGHVWEFHDFKRTDDNPAPGHLKQHLGPGRQKTEYEYDEKTGRLSTIRRFSISSGSDPQVTEIFDFEPIEDGENFGRIRSVTLRREGHPQLSGNVKKVVYSYYGTDIFEKGLCGDLRFAAIMIPDRSDQNQWNVKDLHYYRYHTSAPEIENPKTFESDKTWRVPKSPMCQGWLMNYFGPERCRQFFDQTTSAMYLAETPPDLVAMATLPQSENWISDLAKRLDRKRKPLADLGVSYKPDDTVHRISAGADAFATTFDYSDPTASLWQSGDEDYNLATYRTTETRPDGSSRTIYMNHTGQPMVSAFDYEEKVVGGTEKKSIYKVWLYYPDNGDLMAYAGPDCIKSVDGHPTGPSIPSTNIEFTPTNWPTDISSHDIDSLPTIQLYPLAIVFDSQDGMFHVHHRFKSTRKLAATSIRRGQSGFNEHIGNIYYYQPRVLELGPQQNAAVFAVQSKLSFLTKSRYVTTSYRFEYHAAAPFTGAQPNLAEIELPAVPINQNGVNQAGIAKMTFDIYGYSRWSKDMRGVLGFQKYDSSLGVITQVVEDVNTSLAGFTAPTGFGTTKTNGRFGLHRASSITPDIFGRPVEVLHPKTLATAQSGNTTQLAQATTQSVYRDIEGEVWVTELVDGSRPAPIRISRHNRNGQVLFHLESPTGSIDQASIPAKSTWSRLTQLGYDDHYRRIWQRSFDDIASESYLESSISEYDELSRPTQMKIPDGTLQQLIYDSRGLPTHSLTGRHDIASGGTPVLTQRVAYDKRGLPYEREEVRGTTGCSNSIFSVVETTKYDWRGRVLSVSKPTGRTIENFYEISSTDEYVVDIPHQTKRYQGGEKTQSVDTNTIDTRGNLFRIVRADSNSKVTYPSQFWRDQNGQVILQLLGDSGLFVETRFDGLNREYDKIQQHHWKQDEAITHFNTNRVMPSDAVVIERLHLVHDHNDNVVLNNFFQGGRYDDPFYQSSVMFNPFSLTTAQWFDGLGRSVAAADFGKDLKQERPGQVPTFGQSSVQLTRWYFNAAGELETRFDPQYKAKDRGASKFEYDSLGRLSKTIDGSNSTIAKTTELKYHGFDQVRQIEVANASTGPQITQYKFGTTVPSSDMATGALISEVVLPDNRKTTYTYNRQSQVTTKLDANGTLHSYGYDEYSRLTDDCVSWPTSKPAHIEDRITHLQYKYFQGNLQTARSFAQQGDNIPVHSISRDYTLFGLLEREYQTHKGTSTNWSFELEYDFENGAQPRITTQLYQGAIMLPGEEKFGASGWSNVQRRWLYEFSQSVLRSVDKALQRPIGVSLALSFKSVDVHKIKAITNYSYRGASNLELYSVNNLDERSSLSASLGYNDHFGRSSNRRWSSGLSEHDEVDLKFDASNNIKTCKRLDGLLNNESNDFQYDALNRLTRAAKGQMVLDEVDDPTVLSEWPKLDSVDNWLEYNHQDKSAPATNIRQTRRHGTSNRIIEIGGDPVWIKPEYDEAGNMVVIPQPKDPSKLFRCEYDAWNRLTKISDDQGNLVARYFYDAMGRRIIKRTPAENSTFRDRHFYYDVMGRVSEERVSETILNSDIADPTSDPMHPDRQFFYGADGDLNFVDIAEVVGNGLTKHARLAKRQTLMRDHLGSLLTVIEQNVTYDAAGKPTIGNQSIARRYSYDAYGRVRRLDNQFKFVAIDDVHVHDDYLFAGMRYDRETGLFHTHYRQYHPLLGVWMGHDPMSYHDSTNLYQYGLGNPSTNIDPNGGIVVAPIILFGAALILGGAALLYAGSVLQANHEEGTFWHDVGRFTSATGKIGMTIGIAIVAAPAIGYLAGVLPYGSAIATGFGLGFLGRAAIIHPTELITGRDFFSGEELDYIDQYERIGSFVGGMYGGYLSRATYGAARIKGLEHNNALMKRLDSVLSYRSMRFLRGFAALSEGEATVLGQTLARQYMPYSDKSKNMSIMVDRMTGLATAGASGQRAELSGLRTMMGHIAARIIGKGKVFCGHATGNCGETNAIAGTRTSFRNAVFWSIYGRKNSLRWRGRPMTRCDYCKGILIDAFAPSDFAPGNVRPISGPPIIHSAPIAEEARRIQ